MTKRLARIEALLESTGEKLDQSAQQQAAIDKSLWLYPITAYCFNSSIAARLSAVLGGKNVPFSAYGVFRGVPVYYVHSNAGKKNGNSKIRKNPRS